MQHSPNHWNSNNNGKKWSETHLRGLIFQNSLTPFLRRLSPLGLPTVVTTFLKSCPPYSIPLYAPEKCSENAQFNAQISKKISRIVRNIWQRRWHAVDLVSHRHNRFPEVWYNLKREFTNFWSIRCRCPPCRGVESYAGCSLNIVFFLIMLWFFLTLQRREARV